MNNRPPFPRLWGGRPHPLSHPLPTRKGAAGCRTPGSGAEPPEQPSRHFRRGGFQSGTRNGVAPSIVPPGISTADAQKRVPPRGERTGRVARPRDLVVGKLLGRHRKTQPAPAAPPVAISRKTLVFSLVFRFSEASWAARPLPLPLPARAAGAPHLVTACSSLATASAPRKFGLDAADAVGQSDTNGILAGCPRSRHPKAIPEQRTTTNDDISTLTTQF